MTNREKFKEEILDIIIEEQVGVAIDKKTLKPCGCDVIACHDCLLEDIDNCSLQEWANAEYVEPSVDWNKVPVDTPILVRDEGDFDWKRRYYSGHILENGKIGAWVDGKTKWTVDDEENYCWWDYAKLADTEDANND